MRRDGIDLMAAWLAAADAQRRGDATLVSELILPPERDNDDLVGSYLHMAELVLTGATMCGAHVARLSGHAPLRPSTIGKRYEPADVQAGIEPSARQRIAGRVLAAGANGDGAAIADLVTGYANPDAVGAQRVAHLLCDLLRAYVALADTPGAEVAS